jgi:glycosyltransferase involved in cell wall biosynthesis
LHGKNYETGIITNKTIEDYSEAIIEIMEDERLRENLKAGAYGYAVENFSSEALFSGYCKILGSL